MKDPAAIEDFLNDGGAKRLNRLDSINPGRIFYDASKSDGLSDESIHLD
jgi:hypothetical protein